MPSINKTSTLIKLVSLTNMVNSEEGLALTPMLVGKHGIGKSQIVKAAAREIGADAFTIEGGSLNEGEITGLPFAFKNDDGSRELRFIKYYQVNKIAELEKYYYQKALTTGFLNGTVKIERTDDGEYLIEGKEKRLVRTPLDLIKDGEDNAYKFGFQLSPETKLKLIESGEISPVILFIDEINRTEMQVMKELMNIILNRCVNGYEFPWWVQIVSAINPSSQNSTYATNEMDDAQISRFIRIKVDANLEEWVDYALAKNMNHDVVDAIATSEAIFNHKEKSQEDETELFPDPRGWEMVNILLSYKDIINSTRYFSSEEKNAIDDNVRILVRGKVGETAARTFFENLNNKDNNIKPVEIINGKDMKIDPKVSYKFANLKRLNQKIISDNVVNYIVGNINDVHKKATSSKEEDKKFYGNYMSQLKEFTNLLDTATQILFVKKFLKVPNGTQIFHKVSKAFSKEILANILDVKDGLNDLLK